MGIRTPLFLGHHEAGLPPISLSGFNGHPLYNSLVRTLLLLLNVFSNPDVPCRDSSARAIRH